MREHFNVVEEIKALRREYCKKSHNPGDIFSNA